MYTSPTLVGECKCFVHIEATYCANAAAAAHRSTHPESRASLNGSPLAETSDQPTVFAALSDAKDVPSLARRASSAVGFKAGSFRFRA